MSDTAAEPTPELVEISPQITAVVKGAVPVAELAGFFDRSFGVLREVLADQGATVESPAIAVYREAITDTATLEVGFVTAAAVVPEDSVVPGELPGGRVARLVHRGAFDQLASSWSRLEEWMVAQGLTPGPVVWEVYLTQPSPDMDPADLRTELNWPVAADA